MSLDFTLHSDGYVDIYYAGNMTHNVINMWAEAGVYDSLYTTKGQIAATIIPSLQAGIADMAAYPEKYEKLNAPNGWGLYKNAYPFLLEVYRGCIENPQAFIDIFD